MWDTKYRPLKFSDVLGQAGAVAVLKARLKNGTAMDTSYLFCGGSGIGKTTLARIHARAMLCQQLNMDDPEPCNECDNCKAFLAENSQAFVERDAASQGTVEDIRQIVRELPFTVLGAPKRVYLFDECHRMSKDAQDALLKPVEEKLMVAMFATTEPEKVRAAIRSRSEEHTIRKATREEILAWVKTVLEKESVRHQDDAVLTVIDYAGGHIRDVLNRLEMIAQGGDITVDRVRDHLNLGVVSSYFEILLRLPVDLPGALEHLDRVCERVTAEEAAVGLAEAAMNAFRLANRMMADFTFTDRELATKVHAIYGNERLIQISRHFLRSRYLTNVGLVCEIASLAKALNGGDEPPPIVKDQPITPVYVVLSTSPSTVEAPSAPVEPKASEETPSAPAPKASEPPPPPPAPAAAPATEPAPVPKVAAPRKLTRQEILKLPYIPAELVGGESKLELTDCDKYVVKANTTRPRNIQEADKSSRSERTPLSPEAWRRVFHGLLRMGRVGRG